MTKESRGIMSINFKEIRRKTKMTQRELADLFGIPISTLRKWEQGESTPPVYVTALIAKALPVTDESLRVINGRDGNVYYHDKVRSCLLDEKGNAITIKDDLNGVKERNLGLYVSDLFERFYEIQSRFESDCYYDRKEDINWI